MNVGMDLNVVEQIAKHCGIGGKDGLKHGEVAQAIIIFGLMMYKEGMLAANKAISGVDN